jgi:serine/threonine-protein kinase
MDLLTAHMRDDPAPLRQERPETPSDLEEIILTCLRKNPDERFANVESLDRALAACEAAGQWDKDQARNWWRRTECAVTAAVAG